MGFDSKMRLSIACVLALIINIACFGNAVGQVALSPTDTSVMEGHSISLTCTTTDFSDYIQFRLNTTVKGTCLASLPCTPPTGPYTLTKTGTTQTIFTITSFNCTSDAGDWTCNYGSPASAITKLTCDYSVTTAIYENSTLGSSSGESWCSISDDGIPCIILIVAVIQICTLVMICSCCNEKAPCYGRIRCSCMFIWPACTCTKGCFKWNHCHWYILMVIARICWLVIPGVAIVSLCFCHKRSCCGDRCTEFCGNSCYRVPQNEIPPPTSPTSVPMEDKSKKDQLDKHVRHAMKTLKRKFPAEVENCSDIKSIKKTTKQLVSELEYFFKNIDESNEETRKALEDLSPHRQNYLSKTLRNPEFCNHIEVANSDNKDMDKKATIIVQCLISNLTFVDEVILLDDKRIADTINVTKNYFKKFPKLNTIVDGILKDSKSNQLFYENDGIHAFIEELEEDILFHLIRSLHGETGLWLSPALKVTAFKNVLKSTNGKHKLTYLVHNHTIVCG